MRNPVVNIKALFGPEAGGRWRRAAAWAVAAAVVIAIVAAAAAWQSNRTSKAQTRYTTEPVTRGHLVVTVTTNGTLVPTNKVDIGSELSGTVSRVLVDVNDRVRKGQVLAELDTARLNDQVMRSRAALQVAQAKVAQTQATVRESSDALQRLRDVSRLSGGRVPARSEMAAAEATLARANADAASANASVADARAALSADETNLRKAAIRSPINGVVLSRSVDPGNAVAASLQAVTLFTIAEDLTQMKLQVDIDEADVGQVAAGQKASFTVSSYPSRNYPATVSRVYYGSTVKNNVVTYTGELQVDNQDLSLRPGMTATAVVVTSERDNVLLVPNAALRFTPQAASAQDGGIVSRLTPRMPARPGRRAGTEAVATRQLWILRDGQPVAVTVTAGATNGRVTEVSGAQLEPGVPVITGQVAGKAP